MFAAKVLDTVDLTLQIAVCKYRSDQDSVHVKQAVWSTKHI